MMVKNIWLVVDLPLCKMMEFVSWDYEIPNIWKVIKHVPNHQPGYNGTQWSLTLVINFSSDNSYLDGT